MTITAPPDFLLSPSKSRLALIDVQDRLLSAIDGADRVVGNCEKLVRAALRLGVPMAATEQNPAGIGPTTASLATLIPLRFEKVHFSAAREVDFLSWAASGGTMVLAGTEAHICVLQTALGLKALGLNVVVVIDACGSRQEESRQSAFVRLRQHGVELLTVEMVLFEWLERYDRPEFKEMLRLIK